MASLYEALEIYSRKAIKVGVKAIVNGKVARHVDIWISKAKDFLIK